VPGSAGSRPPAGSAGSVTCPAARSRAHVTRPPGWACSPGQRKTNYCKNHLIMLPRNVVV